MSCEYKMMNNVNKGPTCLMFRCGTEIVNSYLQCSVIRNTSVKRLQKLPYTDLLSLQTP